MNNDKMIKKISAVHRAPRCVLKNCTNVPSRWGVMFGRIVPLCNPWEK